MRQSVPMWFTKAGLLLMIVAALITAPAFTSAHSNRSTEFIYVGGTEHIHRGCGGKLRVMESALIFDCPGGEAAANYSSIEHMEYRSQVSKSIQNMTDVKWQVKPPYWKSKHNLFFTVVYTGGGKTHVMVLKAKPDTMRPYLAEIDLQTGHRVDVQQYY